MSTDNIVLLSWAVLIIGLQVWLFMAAPPKKLVKKYSGLILLRSILPSKTWQRNIDAADVELVQRYRKRVIPYLFILVLSGIVVGTYFYLRYLMEIKSLLETGGR